MTQDSEYPAVDRIERAVARIEHASTARAFTADSMVRRHAALRARMEEAVAALGALIERQDARGEPSDG